MKQLLIIAALGWMLATASQADQINLYVDSAPNVYGSPSYPAWWANARSSAAAGTFVNMANSVNPANSGTTSFELEDSVVYSFGDLGQRMQFVYWIPNETIANLNAMNFQIGMSYTWDGVKYDFYNDYYGNTWQTPTRWEEYNGGVVGTAGFAWWGAYYTSTPAELAQDLADWRPYFEDITLFTRMGNVDGPSLTARSIPDGGLTAMLLGMGMMSLGWVRRQVKR